MANDDLRMTAAVEDRASGPLINIARRLNELKAPPALGRISEQLGEIDRRARGLATGGWSMMSGAMGLGGLTSVSAGLGVLIDRVGKLAAASGTLRQLARETGATVDQLRTLRDAGDHLGVPFEQMDRALGNLSRKMVDLRRNNGELFNALRVGPGMPGVLKQIQEADGQFEKQVGILLGALSKIQGRNPSDTAQLQRQWAETIFGDGDIARLIQDPEKFKKVIGEAQKRTAATPLAEFDRQSKEAKEGLKRFNDEIDRFVKEVAPGLMKGMTSFVQFLDRFGKAGKGDFDALKSILGLGVPGGAGAGDSVAIQSQLATKEKEQREAQDRGDFPAYRMLGNEIRMLRDALEKLRREGATVQQQSFDGSTGGGGLAGLIHRAGLNSGTLPAFGGSPLGRAAAAGAFSTPGSRDPSPGQGGSRSWRNRNPGNIEYGDFARSMGATGSDGRFAIFPDYATGRAAQEKLLFESKNYKDLTLGQAIRRWAPGSENNVPAYLRAMGGDNPDKRMSQYTAEERKRLLDAMQTHEGWKPGGGGPELITDAIKRAREAGLEVTSGYRSPNHPLSRANPRSAHSRGMAFDTRAKTLEEADAAMAKIRTMMSGRGLVEGRDYRILDEVRKRSPWATGPHIHTEFTKQGAERWKGDGSELPTGDIPRSATGAPHPFSLEALRRNKGLPDVKPLVNNWPSGWRPPAWMASPPDAKQMPQELKGGAHLTIDVNGDAAVRVKSTEGIITGSTVKRRMQRDPAEGWT